MVWKRFAVQTLLYHCNWWCKLILSTTPAQISVLLYILFFYIYFQNWTKINIQSSIGRKSRTMPKTVSSIQCKYLVNNHKMDRTEVTTLCYFQFRVQYFLILHTFAGNFNLNKKCNTTIYLINDLVAQYTIRNNY